MDDRLLTPPAPPIDALDPRHAEAAGGAPPATAVSEQAGAATADPAAPAPRDRVGAAGGRLLSLDVFRGATIAGMLIVNNPGSWSSIYPPLRHAAWHGWTPTDLIFPFFLFIVGVAMTFSFGKLLERGASRGELLAKAARRSLMLFGLGLFLHAFPRFDLETIRIPGVLQRIAIASFLATVIVLFTRMRGRAIAAAALLLGYWALLVLVPVPGGAAGVLEPGQDLGAWLDRAVFGTSHLWVYAKTWDPEGLLSTLPAVATVLLGVLAGHWIRAGHEGRRIVAGLAAAGVVLTLVGHLWGLVFPVNKSLWTSSYTVLTAGLACLCLAACYGVVDVAGRRRWATPFLVFGTNAIAAFFLSGLGAKLMNLIRVGEGEGVALKTFLYDGFFTPYLAPLDASLAFALAYTGFWLAIVAVLYRKGIFIKV